MTSPIEGNSFRNRWFSQKHSEFAICEENDLEKKIVQEHLSDGWTQEEEQQNDKFTFSIYLQDGRKWTRQYDRKTCQFISQNFFCASHIARANLNHEWPL